MLTFDLSFILTELTAFAEAHKDSSEISVLIKQLSIYLNYYERQPDRQDLDVIALLDELIDVREKGATQSLRDDDQSGKTVYGEALTLRQKVETANKLVAIDRDRALIKNKITSLMSFCTSG